MKEVGDRVSDHVISYLAVSFALLVACTVVGYFIQIQNTQ